MVINTYHCAAGIMHGILRLRREAQTQDRKYRYATILLIHYYLVVLAACFNPVKRFFIHFKNGAVLVALRALSHCRLYL
jgi:hypothetical protein